GMRLRVPGAGEASPNGGPAGDLYVIVRVKEHPYFQREDAHLLSEIKITPAQAVLGDRIKIKTIDGEVEMNIPPGTQHGEQFRLKNMGMPVLGSSERGHHFVRVNVVIPKHINSKQKELWEKLRKLD
ncbi:MAG: DnaJ C-terminal domain-containing protein, partial [Thermoplasmata archaeon]